MSILRPLAPRCRALMAGLMALGVVLALSQDPVTPAFAATTVQLPNKATVTFKDSDGNVIPTATTVRALQGTVVKATGTTGAVDGKASFQLPIGSYSFRVEWLKGLYLSSADCVVKAAPEAGCQAVIQLTKPAVVTYKDQDGVAITGSSISIKALQGTVVKATQATNAGDGKASFQLPVGTYRFRVDLVKDPYVSTADCVVAAATTCALASSAEVRLTPKVSAKVVDFAGAGQAVTIKAMQGTVVKASTTTGGDGTTATPFQLPVGSYRFRVDVGKDIYYSAASDTCQVQATSIGNCALAAATVKYPQLATVTFTNHLDVAKGSGFTIRALQGTVVKATQTSGAAGTVSFQLPPGNYRFRADDGKVPYFSATTDNCVVLLASTACATAAGSNVVKMTPPVIVTLKKNPSGVPIGSTIVRAFQGTTQKDQGTTGEDGTVTFQLPAGSYRFRADMGARQFWSPTLECVMATGSTCAAARSLVEAPEVTVEFKDSDGVALAADKTVKFYVGTILKYTDKTDSSGTVTALLPVGTYKVVVTVDGKLYSQEIISALVPTA